ncbi:YbjQ family protein [Thalassobacillus sp. CUG 92003]|uniref:YbjQ family protein n=1 Tax=Thalassobacillus sp. CUG 92003 TaxID=2736641 RepID=UPI0015E71102|nr:YbjQ family protein [Thalassobacillus sp. CUG 92003]
MIIVTTDYITGSTINDMHGLVRGSTVQSKNVGRDILAGLKNIVGGELTDYTSMMDEARQQAIKRMIKHAESKGANGIVSMRLETSQISSGASEIIAYGTAVTIGS